MHLSDLSPQERAEIIKQREKDTQLLRELAREHPNDSLIQGANDLDIMAKLLGVYVEYDEDMDQEDF